MRVKLKTIVLTASLLFNALAAAAFSKTASVSFPAPDGGRLAAAAVVSFPSASELVFSPLEIALKPDEKISLQYSVIASGKQSNVLINSLYDPEIISVSRTASGIEITAKAEGRTVMQAVANDGIKDVAVITVAAP